MKTKTTCKHFVFVTANHKLYIKKFYRTSYDDFGRIVSCSQLNMSARSNWFAYNCYKLFEELKNCTQKKKSKFHKTFISNNCSADGYPYDVENQI